MVVTRSLELEQKLWYAGGKIKRGHYTVKAEVRVKGFTNSRVFVEYLTGERTGTTSWVSPVSLYTQPV
jgi:hypothetical protein